MHLRSQLQSSVCNITTITGVLTLRSDGGQGNKPYTSFGSSITLRLYSHTNRHSDLEPLPPVSTETPCHSATPACCCCGTSTLQRQPSSLFHSKRASCNQDQTHPQLLFIIYQSSNCDFLSNSPPKLSSSCYPIGSATPLKHSFHILPVVNHLHRQRLPFS